MALLEEFFDLRIATIEPGETPPPEAHIARMISSPPDDSWFLVPGKVRYLATVPQRLDADKTRKARSLIRKVDARYRLVEDPGVKRIKEFHDLYLKTVASRPRGIDRIGEHERPQDKWSGLYLMEGDALAAGVLVQRVGRHLSVSYGAFDPKHCAKLDLEHFLIMKALDRSAALGYPEMSLGVDTNRYGHHLALGLPAYKWRIGFRAEAYRPGGREYIKPLKFDVFEKGLFFYAFGEEGLEGHLFTSKPADAKQWKHECGPGVVMHAIP